MPRQLERGENLARAVLLCIVLVLFVLPVGLSGQIAFRGGLALILEALARRSVPHTLWNSLESARLSAVLVLVPRIAVTLILGLTKVRAKGAFAVLFLIPMMILPHVTATA
jgi:iron(III) transport system permease protein